ncbi:helix-turn-helix domain-containing protein [Cohnella nanjingensis]|uniref:MerR family transcriptional regulator n=1 Tax=Cohnella nanjingensis TaxID=1387779 RepID=A0A7X0RKR5_9BACL|nr:MerR family transcriptional regulator [Cohnella nanjingensis]MBB6669329.1 MerR family transcriptional regulator [Cohnella nanjingensis]
MDSTMTIQTFSYRTGLPASTLRYYEKEGLLLPEIRAENGYRLYSEKQIPRAINIHSLRQAGISLTDIRSYLAAGDEEKEEWLRKWRQDIDAKLSILNVAKQFLYGIEPRVDHIRLVRWDDPVLFLWFRHRVKRQLNPFARAIEESAAILSEQGLLFSQEAFVQHEKIVGDEMIGKVGFRLRGKLPLQGRLKQYDSEIETLEPTLFVALDCLSNDPYACFSHMLLLQSFGFEPTGPNLERYQLHEKSHYEMMIPVVHETN